MIRRCAASLAVVAAIALGAASLASCGSVDRRDAVASVGDEELTQAQLETVVRSPIAGGELVTGTVDGNLARNIISVWIQATALEAAGYFDGLDRDAARTQTETDIGAQFTSADEFTQNLLISNTLVNQALSSGALTLDEARAAIAAADVDVASRFGRWDPALTEVRPLGG